MKIVIVAAGEMGSGIGARLRRGGADVVTSLQGRSAASAERAARAGMTPVDDDRQLLDKADILLSILPPAQAVDLARRFAPVLADAGGRVAFADCNAVAPATVGDIAGIVQAAGAPFADIGIVGGPPRGDEAGPRLYVSGDGAERMGPLKDLGLDLRRLDGPAGAASALKMSYASITKGLTALGANLGMAALDPATGQALSDELRASQPQLFAWLARQVPGMYPKAYRWDGEMEEIAKFLGDAPGAQIFLGAAGVYRRMARAWGEGPDDDVIRQLGLLLPPAG